MKIYNPGHLYQQLIVTKADTNGFIWAIGTQNTSVYPFKITSDKTGNIYVWAKYNGSICTIGTITLSNPMNYDMYFLTKISAVGSCVVGPGTSLHRQPH